MFIVTTLSVSTNSDTLKLILLLIEDILVVCSGSLNDNFFLLIEKILFQCSSLCKCTHFLTHLGTGSDSVSMTLCVF